MQVDMSEDERGLVLAIQGILKKPDAMELNNAILAVAQKKPDHLTLDFSEMPAMSFDSVPFIVSALERGRLGKRNVSAAGCNSVVERTLRGGGFERVGTFEK